MKVMDFYQAYANQDWVPEINSYKAGFDDLSVKFKRDLELLIGMANNSEPVDALKNMVAYMEMILKL